MLQKFTTDLSRARQNVFVGTTEGVLFTLLVLGANEIRGVVCVPVSFVFGNLRIRTQEPCHFDALRRIEVVQIFGGDNCVGARFLFPSTPQGQRRCYAPDPFVLLPPVAPPRSARSTWPKKLGPGPRKPGCIPGTIYRRTKLSVSCDPRLASTLL
jgi:hypothetical protein